MSKFQYGMQRDIILNAAVEEAKKVGYTNIRRDDVSARAKVSKGLVTYYFKSLENLRIEVMQYAIDKGVDIVVAQGLVIGDPLAIGAPQGIKDKAAMYLTGKTK